MSEPKFTKGAFRVELFQSRIGSKATVYTVVTDEVDVVVSDLCIRNEYDAHLFAASPLLFKELLKLDPENKAIKLALGHA